MNEAVCSYFIMHILFLLACLFHGFALSFFFEVFTHGTLAYNDVSPYWVWLQN